MKDNRVILERRFVAKDTVFINAGEDAYAAYLIQSGSVSVFNTINDKEIELARLGIGEVCGEMALINEERRSASVRTLEDCNLIVITRSAFEKKLENTDATIVAVVRMLIERIKSSNSEIIDFSSEKIKKQNQQ